MLQRLKITLSTANSANRDICESLFACFSRAPINELELDYGSYHSIPSASGLPWTSLDALTLLVTINLSEHVCASFATPLMHCPASG